MRPEHEPIGEPFCTLCGKRSDSHRKRARFRSTYMQDYYKQYGTGKPDERDRAEYFKDRDRWREDKRHVEDLIIGVDGEGQGRIETGGHHYTFLAGSDEHDERWSVYNA